MPTKTRTPCIHPGCPNLVATPGRCPEHATAYDRRKKRSSPWRNYGTVHKRARDKCLARDPICTCQLNHPKCCHNTAPSTVAHHLIRQRDGGANHESNYQGLCHGCHSAHTLHELAQDRHNRHQGVG